MEEMKLAKKYNRYIIGISSNWTQYQVLSSVNIKKFKKPILGHIKYFSISDMNCLMCSSTGHI